MNKPKYREVPVEDITVLFTSGQERTWTLTPEAGDRVEELDADWVIHAANERVVLRRDHIVMYQRRARVQRHREPDTPFQFGVQG